MLIKDRVQLIMKMHNLNAAAFADKIGVQRSNVSHVLSGRSKPGLDFLEKIITHFPRVDANWLVTGTRKAEQSNVQVLSNDVISENNLQKKDAITAKKIIKMVEFYEDGSFKVFIPSVQ